MKLKKQSKAQKRANARNLLFRQIYGYNLGSFISKAKVENAITVEEIECLDKIQDILSSLKQKYFDNSKNLDCILVDDVFVVILQDGVV